MANYKLCFYVPPDHLENVKEAIFEAGAGRIGDYDNCCWQILGQGQFRPLPGTNPFIGEEDVIATVPEYKVEMVCGGEYLTAAITALKETHPYEEPAYDVWAIEER